MEGFSATHLTDEHMKELNPIIRNAVYTALYSLHYYKYSDKIKEYTDFQFNSIPDYWEEPELIRKAGG